MNKKQKIIVSITGIFIVLLALVGLTYAYFLTRITGNSNDKSISVTTANLRLIYADGSPNVVETNIEPNDMVYEKTFTVYNDGNVNTDYGVYLIDVINTFERKDDLKYTMECTTNGTLPCGVVGDETTFPSGISQLSTATIEPNKTHTYTFKFTYKDSGTNQSVDMGKKLEAKIQIFAKHKDGEYYPYEEGTLTYKILNNVLNATGTATTLSSANSGGSGSKVFNYKATGEEATFTNKASLGSYASKTIYYYDTYEINEKSGKFTLSGKHSCIYNSTITNTDGETVNCYDDIVNKYLFASDQFTYNFKENEHTAETISNLSMVYKVTSATSTNYNYVAVFNSPNEAVRALATTPDDYGISYYYIGDIKDNYVNFAGMCWRIVRIEGDGSIKLILEDRYTTCNDTEDTDGTGTTDYAYTGNWSDNKTYVFGTYDNFIVDFLNYSGGLADSFQAFQVSLAKKINKSLTDMSTNEELNESLASKLKVDEWCFDNTISSYTLNDFTRYGAGYRVGGGGTFYPSLNCSGTKLTKYRDGTNMYVGTLTADEIAFAGSANYLNRNYNFYLINNYAKGGSKEICFWSLSPGSFSAEKATAFYLNSYGSLQTNDVSKTSNNVQSIGYSRPAITLKSGTVITGGNGTQLEPYEVG